MYLLHKAQTYNTLNFVFLSSNSLNLMSLYDSISLCNISFNDKKSIIYATIELTLFHSPNQ